MVTRAEKLTIWIQFQITWPVAAIKSLRFALLKENWRISTTITNDDVIKWKQFPRYWPLCGEFISQRQIPLTKAIELWCFLWSAPEQTVEQIIEMSVIWDLIMLIMMLLPWSDCYTFDVVSQSNSTTQIAEQRQIFINRYLSWHCRCRNQISSWHRMADVRFYNQNSILSTSLPYRLPYRHGILLPISKWYQNGNVM